jgi:hypothetical protein
VSAARDHSLARKRAFHHLHQTAFPDPEFDGSSQKALSGLLYEDHGAAAIIYNGRFRNDGNDVCDRGQQANMDNLIDCDAAVPIVDFVDYREGARGRVHNASDGNQTL